jgi:hypothetical protein
MKKNTTNRYNLSGVYQLWFRECPCRYIDQRGKTFKTRFKEHIRDIKYNGQYPKFSPRIIDPGHEWDTMEKAMRILHIEKKGQMLNTYERLYIYEASEQSI